MNYKNYQKLINKISWSWNKKTGIEFETLQAEANLIFAKCQNQYNPARGKFSTLLYHNIENHFKTLIGRQRQNRYDGIEIEFEDFIHSHSAKQERQSILMGAINALSKEAKEIVTVILEAPADLLEMLPKPRISKHQLTKYLRHRGWKFPAITKAFDEIKQGLNF